MNYYNYSSSSASSNQQSLLIVSGISFVLGACSIYLASLAHVKQQQQQQQQLYDNHDLELREDKDSSNDANSIIYMDYNGTTPVTPSVLQAMTPYFTKHYGNPSSSHVLATAPKQAMSKARLQILTHLLGVSNEAAESMESSIVFTSCGTESDNLAIQLALQLHHAKRSREANESQQQDNNDNENTSFLPHIVTTNVEHPAVEQYLQHLERRHECIVSYVPVQSNGCVRASDVIAAMTPRTILVTLMHANNESGALQPVAELCDYIRKNQLPILVHSDAAQSAAKVSVKLRDLKQPHMVSLVGHKLGAPKGVACLYMDAELVADIQKCGVNKHGVSTIGGAQEFGLRAGTPNVPYIVGMGQAAEEAASHLQQHASHLEQLRSRLLAQLIKHLGSDNVRANGPDEASLRLPNTLSVGIRNVHSGDLLQAIGHQVAASAGATCHSTQGVSSVLQAMRVPIEFARGTLRLSLGPFLTERDVDRAAEIIAAQAKRQMED
ncbi:hypothetical protein MPSEU_000875000 [Mayamaea pseudoterrestris]|nr:hypothetical protein MPSEU_000875000 [Mayamaea pseudoterrestris]